jgi:hypothetical protein
MIVPCTLPDPYRDRVDVAATEAHAKALKMAEEVAEQTALERAYKVMQRLRRRLGGQNDAFGFPDTYRRIYINIYARSFIKHYALSYEDCFTDFFDEALTRLRVQEAFRTAPELPATAGETLAG